MYICGSREGYKDLILCKNRKTAGAVCHIRRSRGRYRGDTAGVSALPVAGMPDFPTDLKCLTGNL